MKRFILIFVIILIPMAIFAQSNLSVPLDDEVYTLLDIANGRGIINNLSEVKPYNRGKVIEYLKIIDTESEKLTDFENTIFDGLSKRFGLYQEPSNGFNLNKGDFVFGTDTDTPFVLGFDIETENRLNVSNLPNGLSTHNLFDFYILGDLGSFVSYKMDVSVTLDKLTPENWLPYTYSPQWDGAHLAFSGTGQFLYDDKLNDEISMALSSSPEISASLFDDKLELAWRKVRRNWGGGNGSLILSSSAQSFDGVEMLLQPVEWVKYSYLTGSLSDGLSFLKWKSSNNDVNREVSPTDEKMYTIRNVEFFFLDRLYISFGESVVWAKRFELGYLNPFMLSTLYQIFSGDSDNMGIHGTVAVKLPYVQPYFNLFVDEIGSQGVLASGMGFFNYLKNIYAFSTGIEVSLPFVPFSKLTLQYRKTEPYCYTHYAQETPHQTAEVMISYTNQGTLLTGLPPNSDEFFVGFESLPVPNLSVSAGYRLVRHGDNDLGYGDIDDNWLGVDYKTETKKFLEDGIYDITHEASISASYRFSGIPLKLNAEYGFSFTGWSFNKNASINDIWITSELNGSDEIKNIFILKAEIF